MEQRTPQSCQGAGPLRGIHTDWFGTCRGKNGALMPAMAGRAHAGFPDKSRSCRSDDANSARRPDRNQVLGLRLQASLGWTKANTVRTSFFSSLRPSATLCLLCDSLFFLGDGERSVLGRDASVPKGEKFHAEKAEARGGSRRKTLWF